MNSSGRRQETARTARRRLVGRIINTALADAGMTKQDAVRQWPMSKSTIYRLVAGDADVSVTFFREVEIQLELPRRLLRLVAEGDADAIRALPDLDPVLGTWVLRELDAIDAPPHAPRKANNG